MIERDPLSYGILTYVWVFALAVLGGVVGFLRKLQEGVTRAFNVVEFLGEIVTSAFAGIITFWFCESAGFNPLLTAAFVGISGHMGSRALFAFESLMGRLFPTHLK